MNMFKSEIFTNQPLFNKNDTVMMISYTDLMTSEIEYIKLMRRSYKLIKGTWGFTNLNRYYRDPSTYVTPVSLRAYIFFEDKLDSLQFLLMSTVPVTRVFIWPKDLKFTIYKKS